jgi:NDP-sugar pyrophosphorylase family protein
VTAIRAGAVIAAGEGSRLSALGSPKPLVEVAGEPLVAHVLSHFEAAGIERAAVIFNESEEDCAAYVKERFGRMVSKILVKTTASSLESFREVLAAAPPGRLLVSTVDAYLPRPDFLAFVRAAERSSDDTTVLAVTPFVDDEKPLWVSLAADGSGRVDAVGGESGDAVTAGLYVVPERVRGPAPPAGLRRLRDYLGWLHASGEPVSAVSIPKVIDVDRPVDLALAEALARSHAAGGEGR